MIRLRRRTKIGAGEATRTPDNPYITARSSFESLFRNQAKEKHAWRIASLAELIIIGVLVIAYVELASGSRVVPYVVEVDELGQVAAIGPAGPPGNADPRVVARELSALIRNLRSITPDAGLQLRMIEDAYAFLDASAARFLNEYFADPEKLEGAVDGIGAPAVGRRRAVPHLGDLSHGEPGPAEDGRGDPCQSARHLRDGHQLDADPHARYTGTSTLMGRSTRMNLSRELGLVGILLCIGAPGAAQSARLASRESIAAPDRDPIRLAYQDFEETGVARVIRARPDGGHALVPFGHVRAMMRCPRLNACMIVLEPGERLTDQPLSGDTERWIIETSVTGADAPSALVIVKPQFCDIATNLIVPTDRRVYELALVSDSCEDGGDSATYTRQLRFWYPDAMRAERVAEREPQATAPDSVIDADSVADLNREYKVKRGWFLNRKRYAWIPGEVFDDGVRTHIVLPESARNAELPILYALEGDERQVLNYALRGDTIVADRVLLKAVLVVNRGGGEETIEIENRAPARREEGDK